MDLPEIGVHCSLQTCRVLDLLPILCHCSQYFCRYHIDPSAHSCPINTAPVQTTQNIQKREKCNADKCNNFCLESFVADGSGIRIPAICSRCQGSFCAEYVATL